MERFIARVEPEFKASARTALDGALYEAEDASRALGRPNPLV
jgi:hypothetical protein